MLQIRFPYSDWKPAIFVSGLQTVQTNSWLCNLHFLLLFENWANIDSFEKVNIVATLISVSHCILCWTVIWYDFLWLLCHRISWDKEIRTRDYEPVFFIFYPICHFTMRILFTFPDSSQNDFFFFFMAVVERNTVSIILHNHLF